VVAVALVVSLVFFDWTVLEDEAIGARGEQGPRVTALEQLLQLKDECLPTRYMRWLWWPTILYLFWGMGFICDVYFVRTIVSDS